LVNLINLDFIEGEYQKRNKQKAEEVENTIENSEEKSIRNEKLINLTNRESDLLKLFVEAENSIRKGCYSSEKINFINL
jgi:hypothetical protein